jgi:hypothetical protein
VFEERIFVYILFSRDGEIDNTKPMTEIEEKRGRVVQSAGSKELDDESTVSVGDWVSSTGLLTKSACPMSATGIVAANGTAEVTEKPTALSTPVTAINERGINPRMMS